MLDRLHDRLLPLARLVAASTTVHLPEELVLRLHPVLRAERGFITAMSEEVEGTTITEEQVNRKSLTQIVDCLAGVASTSNVINYQAASRKLVSQ